MTDVQAGLDAIRAEMEAQDAAAASAAQAESDRLAKMDAVKAECFAVCGPVSEALAAATDPRERAALIELEARTHEPHRASLEAAHLEASGQRDGDSNAAPPGEVTQIESNVVAGVEVQPDEAG